MEALFMLEIIVLLPFVLVAIRNYAAGNAAVTI